MDGLSSRAPVPGTVPRGYLRSDKEFFTGKKSGSTPVAPPATATTVAPGTTLQGAAAYPDDIDYFPIAVNAEVIRRGKERYEIFCSVCHAPTGNGDGMIVRRGFKRAASFHDDRLRQAPVGHFFDAITNGWGVMPSYASQIPVQDRWAIIAYVRALQLSQPSREGTTTPGGTAPASSQPSPTPGGGHQ